MGDFIRRRGGNPPNFMATGHPAFGFKKQYWTPTKKIA
tara:strand:+ start:954 stop:1067 length:114 start_codon:yes stop_codon:yes gene_type:complete